MNANILVVTEGMSREEWLRWRKKGIGGSDVASILGINKWSSAIEL
jgi:predicted phage-related endonuclease